MWLLFCYTIQLITFNFCTKFQNSNSNSCRKSLTKKGLQTDIQTYYRKGKNYMPYMIRTGIRAHVTSRRLHNSSKLIQIHVIEVAPKEDL